jgi:DNA polymerase-3 subunit delta
MSAKRTRSKSEDPAAYAVCGAEAFLKRQAVDGIMHRVLGEGDRSLTLSEYDGSTAALELASVLDDLRTLPFFAEKRLVMVTEADAFITRYRSDLEAYLESPSSCGVLLLECKSLPANTRLHKRIKQVGEVIKCDQPKSNTVPKWLVQRAQEAYECRLDTQAGALLIDLVGEDLGLLDAELQKLSLYVGKRQRIATNDVEALVGHTREEQVWEILTAIAAGDSVKAMQLWEDVWQTDRAASARAIGGIAFTVRRLLAAKRAQESGSAPHELARMLMRWGQEQQVVRELSAFSVADIEDMLCTLLEADVAAKTGGASVRTSIEAFIVNACQRKQPHRATG